MENSQFKSPDPALTGYLISRGFEPEKLERQNSQISFVFTVTPDLRQAVEDYSFNALAPVREVIGGYRKALNLIRSARPIQNSQIQEFKSNADISNRQ